jgi:prepilin-type N-terminal cleavage/methylation domain-containing protein
MKKKNSKKGFTLIEVIVAMSIFAMMIVSFSVAFSGSFFAYRNSRAIEKNLEEAQNEMNLMAKTMRTSTIVGCSKDPSISLTIPCTSLNNYQWIRIYDYSQGKCIDYEITGNSNNPSSNLLGKNKVLQASVSDTFANCANTSIYSGSSLVSSPSYLLTGNQEYVAGGFYAQPSMPTPATVGKVTIFFQLCQGNSGNTACLTNITGKASIQTTVSLRDYSYSGIQ